MKPTHSELNGKTRRATRHLVPAGLVVLLTVTICVGCKPEAKVAPDQQAPPAAAADVNPVGTYALASVNGSKVPCALQHEGHTMTIKSGSFSINADGTCSSKMFLESREAAIEVKATYAREGKKLTMTWQGAGMTTGTVEGDTFTMENEGMMLVYRK